MRTITDLTDVEIKNFSKVLIDTDTKAVNGEMARFKAFAEFGGAEGTKMEDAIWEKLYVGAIAAITDKAVSERVAADKDIKSKSRIYMAIGSKSYPALVKTAEAAIETAAKAGVPRSALKLTHVANQVAVKMKAAETFDVAAFVAKKQTAVARTETLTAKRTNDPLGTALEGIANTLQRLAKAKENKEWEGNLNALRDEVIKTRDLISPPVKEPVKEPVKGKKSAKKSADVAPAATTEEPVGVDIAALLANMNALSAQVATLVAARK